MHSRYSSFNKELKVRATEEAVFKIEAMGIVSSTFASLAIRFAWNCQRLLDPRYRCVEGKRACDEMSLAVTTESSKPRTAIVAKTSLSHCTESNNSVHQKNRNRRAAQLRHRRRPSSFDTALIVSRNENCTNARSTCAGTSQTLPSQSRQIRPWDVTSSSGCSSDSGSDIDTDSEAELKISGPFCEKLGNTQTEEFTMSAAEEAALRWTVGRGHFSRSKKDKFLNNLRLEKRLNGLNNTIFRTACRNHDRSLQRHYSGDLRKII